MKINIEDYLQKIDNSFKDKAQKDIYMTYIMIFAVIFAFSYLLFWDTSVESFNDTNTKISTIQRKINADNTFLRRNPEVKIAKLDKEIKIASLSLETVKKNNAYIKRKIEAIPFLIYDERTWGEYLHSISKNAKKYDVKILDFTNKYATHNKSFGHILDITLQTTSGYKNTLRFINSLERSDLVVDIHDINIKAEKRLNSDLNISVWGITY